MATVTVLLSDDEKDIYVITCRGFGAGPNGGKNFVKPPQGTYIGDIQLGSFQRIPMPDAKQLAAHSGKTIANTFAEVEIRDEIRNPLPPLPRARQSPIKHIVYITVHGRRSTLDRRSFLSFDINNCQERKRGAE